MPKKCQLNFIKFYSVAANLCAPILPTEVFKATIAVHPAKISRVVNSFVGIAIENGVCHLRVSPITRRKISATYRDFTDLARLEQLYDRLLDVSTWDELLEGGSKIKKDQIPKDRVMPLYADRLAAIDRAAVTGHDHAHLHHQLNQHGHHDVSACLDRAGRHLLDALHTLRRLADHARRGHTPTELRHHLARTLADLDAAGTHIATADRALIHQLKEVIDYPE